MAYRYDDLAPGEVYHICTRGVNKQRIFQDDNDRKRMLDLMVHCLTKDKKQSFSMARKMKIVSKLPREGQGLVDVLAFCLMDNHLHLLIKENVEGGTSLYIQRVLNSYAKYFNLRHKRSGPLFTGRFKAVLVDGDEQLLHVSRYIHLNPYLAHMIDNPIGYLWSSLSMYEGSNKERRCHASIICDLMGDKYLSFVVDEADYLRSIGDIQHLILEDEL